MRCKDVGESLLEHPIWHGQSIWPRTNEQGLVYDDKTHLYVTTPIQVVSLPKLGLKKMSSAHVHLISIGKWTRMP